MRLGQQRSGPTNDIQRGENYFFSPPSPACRTILHAGGNRYTTKGNAGGGCWWCGGGVARGRRLRVVLWLFQTAEGVVTALPFLLCVASSVFGGFLLLSSGLLAVFWFGSFPPFPLSRLFSLFLSLFGFFSSPFLFYFCSIFIGAKGCWALH